MDHSKMEKPPEAIEKTIGRTTYIVTSHFQKDGSTAKDKIRCLIDMNTKKHFSS